MKILKGLILDVLFNYNYLIYISPLDGIKIKIGD
jgi:hypothetical protein